MTLTIMTLTIMTHNMTVSIIGLFATLTIHVGILCFESEVFNFLFSNFSFKID